MHSLNVAPGYTSYGGYQYPSQWQPGQPWWDPVSQQYLYPPQVSLLCSPSSVGHVTSTISYVLAYGIVHYMASVFEGVNARKSA